MSKVKVGYALCGSYCTFDIAIATIESMVERYDVYPIMSDNAYKTDTRFGKAKDFIERIRNICNKNIIHTIEGAEPIGPKRMFDVLVVAPCTGNTISKLTYSITDTAVTMAVKSHLRNARPVILGVSTNDALSGTAKNIGKLLNQKNYYFVPLRQDDFEKKPRSIVCDFSKIPNTIEEALKGKQIQPIIY